MERCKRRTTIELSFDEAFHADEDMLPGEVGLAHQPLQRSKEVSGRGIAMAAQVSAKE